MLVCYWTRRRLGGYADGALDEGASRSTARHLDTCSRCQHELDVIRRLQTRLRAALEPVPSPAWTGFWEGVVREIGERREVVIVPDRQPRRLPRLIAGHRLAFGGALTVAIAVSITVWQLFLAPAPPDAAVVVRSADTEHPTGTVMVYSPPERDLAVVWVFDLDD